MPPLQVVTGEFSSPAKIRPRKHLEAGGNGGCPVAGERERKRTWDERVKIRRGNVVATRQRPRNHGLRQAHKQPPFHFYVISSSTPHYHRRLSFCAHILLAISNQDQDGFFLEASMSWGLPPVGPELLIGGGRPHPRAGVRGPRASAVTRRRPSRPRGTTAASSSTPSYSHKR